jgi:hypothetical protein
MVNMAMEQNFSTRIKYYNGAFVKTVMNIWVT